MAPATDPLMNAGMASVLAAAREADAAVEACARAAEGELAAARATEKSIAASAARRGARIRAVMAERTAQRLAELEALEREALSHTQPEEDDHRRLERALGALAAELTGEAP